MADYARPNLRQAWLVFYSRPVSLLAVLVLCVVLSIVSVMLLIPPLIAAYYFAVARSRREAFFIDIETVSHSVGAVWTGLRRYFFRSYAFFVLGIVPPAALLLWPMVPYLVHGEERFRTTIFEHGIVYQLLLIPAFLWQGAILLYGYPGLIEAGRVTVALRAAVLGVTRSPVLTFVIGFIVLVPVTAFVFHIAMVLSYPFLVAWANTTIGAGDTE